MLENHSNTYEVRATACSAVLLNFSEETALKCHAHIHSKCTRAANEGRTCPALPALTSRQLVGPGQFGERCWQECHLSKTHPDK